MGALVGAFGWESALKLPPELLEEQTGGGSAPPPQRETPTLGTWKWGDAAAVATVVLGHWSWWDAVDVS